MNKKKKDMQKQELKEKSLKGMKKDPTETDVVLQKTAQESTNQTVADDDDREYYRQEVGEEPDKGISSTYLSLASKQSHILVLRFLITVNSSGYLKTS